MPRPADRSPCAADRADREQLAAGRVAAGRERHAIGAGQDHVDVRRPRHRSARPGRSAVARLVVMTCRVDARARAFARRAALAASRGVRPVSQRQRMMDQRDHRMRSHAAPQRLPAARRTPARRSRSDGPGAVAQQARLRHAPSGRRSGAGKPSPRLHAARPPSRAARSSAMMRRS